MASWLGAWSCCHVMLACIQWPCSCHIIHPLFFIICSIHSSFCSFFHTLILPFFRSIIYLLIHSSLDRYVILTYKSEFDRVHFPLPLAYEEHPSLESLQRTIFRLKRREKENSDKERNQLVSVKERYVCVYVYVDDCGVFYCMMMHIMLFILQYCSNISMFDMFYDDGIELTCCHAHCHCSLPLSSRDLKFIDAQLRQENTELRHRLRIMETTRGSQKGGRYMEKWFIGCLSAYRLTDWLIDWFIELLSDSLIH